MGFDALIVGLGNPGKKYEGTRHNVGFAVLDKIQEKYKAAAWKEKFNGLISNIQVEAVTKDQPALNLLLIKPLTYMNLSGEAVAAALNFYQIPTNKLLVIHDDLDLEPFKLKLKSGGGDGGHNGLRSITQLLSSNEYLRLRIGIGKPENKDHVTPWVLGSFFKEESGALADCLQVAATAAVEVFSLGLKVAQNKFNK